MRKTAIFSVLEALDPATSVFVSANAGAGKTRLLADRVLRLLLHGVGPSRVLCLTFTNAAAAEMTARVQGELGAWVMASDEELHKALTGLLPAVDARLMTRARGLFAQVLEAPEGVRIQTIHGFCQSLLRRFPLEAGVDAHFTVMDSRTEQALLTEARLRFLTKAQSDKDLKEALSELAKSDGEAKFQSLMNELIQHKRRLRAPQVDAMMDILWRRLGLSPETTVESLAAAHFAYDGNTLSLLRRITALLLEGAADADRKTGEGLAAWLEAPSRIHAVAYGEVFITDKGTPRKKLFNKDTLTDTAHIDAILAEQERVCRFIDACGALQTAHHTEHLLHAAEGLFSVYETLKRSQALMDYDDLILKARELLKKPHISPWVLYKLDGGIDHVLIDEAQDTSPEQWEIIEALTKEFFAGEGRSERERSIFVVGDEKQSIFSFQGADPAVLGRKRDQFKQRIEAAGKKVHHLALVKSYRSAPEVLSAVDTVFSRGPARQGLTFDDAPLTHTATLSHKGLVEIWPLIQPPDKDTPFYPLARLARTLADTIASWLKEGVILEGKQRPMHAGDIMILVRSRTALVDLLVRALKKRGVPVAGQDRMTLTENLAVQDLMALGQVLLLPEDDLTLASLLKSPIFNMNEEELFQLCHGRKGSVWENLSVIARSETTKQSSMPHQSGLLRPDGLAMTKAFALLTDLRARADFVAPFELYSYLLDTLGARKRFTGRMGSEYQDPIDEFLNQALLYERSHPPSLQGFLHWLETGSGQIKRDMEQASGALRILTVHGAKGLQAPIVILPDTAEPPQLRDNFSWHEEQGMALPFRSSSSQSQFVQGLRERQKEAMYAEYRRLLYVAMTRAEDRLLICGATRHKDANENSWYRLVREGLSPSAEKMQTPWGEGLRIGTLPKRSGVATIVEETISPMPDKRFAFLDKPAPNEPVPPKPLSPSRLPDDQPAGASPVVDSAVYQRGRLIHALLQYLPDIAAEKRAQAATVIASGYPEEIREQCIREALAVMGDKRFAFLFAAGSLAEVPVAGVVQLHGNPVTVSGQIDRLHIGEKEVWIVDFKSNRLPPQAPPVAYRRQLQLYKLLLQAIYPAKTVRCALLWTAAPRLDVLDEALLDEIPASSYI